MSDDVSKITHRFRKVLEYIVAPSISGVEEANHIETFLRLKRKLPSNFVLADLGDLGALRSESNSIQDEIEEERAALHKLMNQGRTTGDLFREIERYKQEVASLHLKLSKSKFDDQIAGLQEKHEKEIAALRQKHEKELNRSIRSQKSSTDDDMIDNVRVFFKQKVAFGIKLDQISQEMTIIVQAVCNEFKGNIESKYKKPKQSSLPLEDTTKKSAGRHSFKWSPSCEEMVLDICCFVQNGELKESGDKSGDKKQRRANFASHFDNPPTDDAIHTKIVEIIRKINGIHKSSELASEPYNWLQSRGVDLKNVTLKK